MSTMKSKLAPERFSAAQGRLCRERLGSTGLEGEPDLSAGTMSTGSLQMRNGARTACVGSQVREDKNLS